MKRQSAHQGIIPGHAIHGKSSERPGDRPGARTAQKLWGSEELMTGEYKEEAGADRGKQFVLLPTSTQTLSGLTRSPR